MSIAGGPGIPCLGCRANRDALQCVEDVIGIDLCLCSRCLERHARDTLSLLRLLYELLSIFLAIPKKCGAHVRTPKGPDYGDSKKT